MAILQHLANRQIGVCTCICVERSRHFDALIGQMDTSCVHQLLTAALEPSHPAAVCPAFSGVWTHAMACKPIYIIVHGWLVS
jgi:hypothetical protein